MGHAFATSDQEKDIHPKVLVVGMSRTGTSSIKRALEILYKAPVYHMSVVLNKPEHLKLWSDLAFGKKGVDEVDWQSFLKGYVATTDFPSAYYFKPLIEAFPNAKVILSTRDEEEWADSYSRLIQAGQRFRFIKFLPPLNRLWPFGEQMHYLIFGKAVIGANGVDRSVVMAGYRKHNDKIRQFLPPERLMEFNVKQGWAPLCEFLGVDIPQTSFPHSNAGAAGPTKIIANAVGRISGPLLALILITATAIFAFLLWLFN